MRKRYEEAGLRHMVTPFLKEMGVAYGAATIAVSRAGAATCMELAACSVPALLVPLPSARRDHQSANARILVSLGAADICPQDDLSVGWLGEYLSSCSRETEKLEKMKSSMAVLAAPDAAERLATVVEGVGNGAPRGGALQL